MAYNEQIEDLTVSTKNHADVFNTVTHKLLENTHFNKAKCEELAGRIAEITKEFEGYLTTEELMDLLTKGIKGDKGDTGEQGISLEYNWDGTSLGIKRTNEEDFTYTNLKGQDGQDGNVSFEELTEEQRLSLKGDKGDPGQDGQNGLTTSITVNGDTHTQDNGNITLPDYPTQEMFDDLKSTVVNGKTSVANAINDKLGTTLSNQTSFNDMATYIKNIDLSNYGLVYLGSTGDNFNTSISVSTLKDVFSTVSAVLIVADARDIYTLNFDSSAIGEYITRYAVLNSPSTYTGFELDDDSCDDIEIDSKTMDLTQQTDCDILYFPSNKLQSIYIYNTHVKVFALVRKYNGKIPY